ncbi:hypothetical protein BpHYR1_000630 [Brachionus plicatilis]|uniref:Transmembrane protein n=1 Tax=Brachionus plicatilis TaxID=10195 RepID=A0A3M7RRI1_BRAPC|nr:hypothetical protein BpHYR1_000630 [Brachionus plicatilis]
MQSAHHRNDAILSGQFFADFFRFYLKIILVSFDHFEYQKLIINFNLPNFGFSESEVGSILIWRRAIYLKILLIIKLDFFFINDFVSIISHKHNFVLFFCIEFFVTLQFFKYKVDYKVDYKLQKIKIKIHTI